MVLVIDFSIDGYGYCNRSNPLGSIHMIQKMINYKHESKIFIYNGTSRAKIHLNLYDA